MATQFETLANKINALPPESVAQLADFVDYLLWQAQKTENGDAVDWTFDFIEHFSEASKRPQRADSGAEIKIEPAMCGGIARPSIYAHPPVRGRSVIEYYVPVPQDIQSIKLNVAIGIRDGAQLDEANLIAFSVRLNGYRVWGAQTTLTEWREYEISMQAPPGDMGKIEFVTEALGDHQYTWAVWGTPTLTGSRED